MFGSLWTRRTSVKVIVASSTLAAYFVPRLLVCPVGMHTKARGISYPAGNIKRFPVPDDRVAWKVPFPEYKPVDYTSQRILDGPVYADPDIRNAPAKPPLKFNQLDSEYNVDRTSYTGVYQVEDGIPLVKGAVSRRGPLCSGLEPHYYQNPCGRTGLTGRGLLGRWGPNHAADPVVTRWKRDIDGKKVYRDCKPVLEFVAIKRRDCGQWAIPGGMVDPGDTVTNTLKKEFGEEALNSMEVSQEERDRLHDALAQCFETGTKIYQDYVDDPRNTDNAWMETQAVNYHDDVGKTFDQFRLQAGDDAGAVAWTEISRDLNLYANHEDMIRKVAELHNAHL